MRSFVINFLFLSFFISTASWSADAKQDPEQTLNTPYKDAHKYTKTEVGNKSLTPAVIYYGEGITNAQFEAHALTASGTPTVAMAGGEPGVARLIVNKKSYGKYTDEGIRDLLGITAERAYREQFHGHKSGDH